MSKIDEILAKWTELLRRREVLGDEWVYAHKELSLAQQHKDRARPIYFRYEDQYIGSTQGCVIDNDLIVEMLEKHVERLDKQIEDCDKEILSTEDEAAR